MADLEIVEQLVPYHANLEIRDSESLDRIVLHCTELPTIEMAREFGERIVHQDNRTGNSGHYYVDRDGALYRYVQDNRVARHVIGYNQHSIGIEMVNLGRYPDWFSSSHQLCTEPYSDLQIQSVRRLLDVLKKKYPRIRNLARHSDLDTQWMPASDDPTIMIRRKIDPGPLFPWDDTLAWWNSL